MYYIFLLIIIVGVLAFLASKKKISSVSDTTEINFELINSVFTPAERSFFGVLNQVVGDEVEILAKVRVADVLRPQKGLGKSAWQTAFNKISRKHFDFVLCNKGDMSVICGIELNDKSHKSSDRKKRDSFLLEACKSAKLPLVMISAQSNYSLSEIRKMLSEYISPAPVEEHVESAPLESDNQDVAESLPEPEATESVKLCPKCSTELVKRIAKKGTHAGKEFWACSAYPKCKYIEQVNA